MSGTKEDIAKELVGQLPLKALYEDSLKEPAKEVGNIASDLLKVAQLALAPIQLMAAVQDRYRNFIDRSVRRILVEQRVSPAPQILGPVLEGIRYEPESTPIDEMFSQLLSRSMDRKTVGEAHPSFPLLIRQLSHDEALILSRLKEREYDYVDKVSEDKIEGDEFPTYILQFPENWSFYMNHLHSLGLAGLFVRGIGTRGNHRFRLTEVGERFINACTDKS